jgi:putative membrane protein
LKLHSAFLAAVCAVLVWSAVHPHDYFTWLLEVIPALIGIPVLIAIYPRFRFTTLVYFLIAIHGMILMVGGHYTYAEVPLFNWIRDHWHLSRNHYDRVGHFAQGFVPAMIARELLPRKTCLQPGGWLGFIVVCICMALSVTYEFVEWWTALATGSAATAFLGTQGDPWDTQWDMFFATIGATCSVLVLSRVQDRQRALLKNSRG